MSNQKKPAERPRFSGGEKVGGENLGYIAASGDLPFDDRAIQSGHPAFIARRYDAANKTLRRADVKEHYERLKSALFSIIANSGHPYLLADVAAVAIEKGLPVDSHALFAPEEVLAVEARFLALAIPTLSSVHGDCRAYLAEKLRRPAERIEPSIPWNFVCGAESINESGE